MSVKTVEAGVTGVDFFRNRRRLAHADLRGDPKGPLFRTIGRGTGKPTRTVLPQAPVR